MAYRAAVHETTKVSPYEIMFDVLLIYQYISLLDSMIPVIVPGYSI